MEKKDIALIAVCVLVMVFAYQGLSPTPPPPTDGLYSDETTEFIDGQRPDGQVTSTIAAGQTSTAPSPTPPEIQPAPADTSADILAAQFADLEPAEPITLTDANDTVYVIDPELGGIVSVTHEGIDMVVGHPDMAMLGLSPEARQWRFSHARILDQTETSLSIERQVRDLPLVVQQTWHLNASEDVPYVIDYDVVLRNIGPNPLELADLTLQSGVMHDLGTPKGFMGAGGIDQMISIRYADEKSPEMIQLKEVQDPDEEDWQEWRSTAVDWIAVQNKYFAAIVQHEAEAEAFAGSILETMPVLDLAISESSDGHVGHILLREPVRRDLSVWLSSSAPEAVRLPGGITIRAGRSAATFPIEADDLVSGVDLQARAESFGTASAVYPPLTPSDPTQLEPSDDLIMGSIVFYPITLAPGAEETRQLHVYIGPKKYDLLDKLGDNLTTLMQFDLFLFFHVKIFEYISLVIFWMLTTFHGIFSSYGVAILLITFILRLLFWPITHRSTMMSRKMQQIAPMAKEMREKYKSDPQKLHQKTMELYKQHKVNPMSGCLPALLQIPVFFALFNVLRSSIELRHASFLWAHDLSLPDTIAIIPLIFFELPLNPLAIIMGVTMMLQMKVVPTTADPSQQRIMMIMSGSFLIFLYSMPSGLTLYWAANQILNIIQYRITHNMMDKEEAKASAAQKP